MDLIIYFDQLLVSITQNNGSKILLVGLAYKSNLDDMRESPTFELMHLLEELGVEVAFYNSYIPTIPTTREHAEYMGRNSVEWNQATISEFDAVLIATDHSDIDYQELADWSNCVIDTRNAMKGIPPRPYFFSRGYMFTPTGGWVLI